MIKKLFRIIKGRLFGCKGGLVSDEALEKVTPSQCFPIMNYMNKVISPDDQICIDIAEKNKKEMDRILDEWANSIREI